MTTPAVIRLPNGTDVDGATLLCEGCGSDVAGHACAGASAPAAPVYVRRTGPRAPISSIPQCAHCGGRIHQNLSAAAVNAECLTRQFAMDTGLMTDPNGRLPVLTLEMMKDIADWGLRLSVPPTYGKMDSAAGGASTYAGLRPKTGRKTKAVAAAPGSQVQDLAKDIEIEDFDEDEEVLPAAPSVAPAQKAKTAKKAKAAPVIEAVLDPTEKEVTAPVAVADPTKLTPKEASARRRAQQAALRDL